MKFIKLPTKVQLIVAGIIWLLANVIFQELIVRQITQQVNCIDHFVTFFLFAVGIFFIFMIQKYATGYFNNLITRIGLLIVLMAKVVFAEKILLSRLITDEAYSMVFEQTLLVRVFTTFLVFSYFAFAFRMLFYLQKYNEEVHEKEEASNSLRDAELIKLRQQLQPHFLFNSLNSINALVGSEPALARKMIQNLSDFLRGTLKKDENKPVALSEEIQLLKLYLDIEKVRFGTRLEVNFEIRDETLDKTLPPLLLQPIVENAIKFGLYNVLENVEIRIRAHYEKGLLTIGISNPFDEQTSTTRKGEGFGLSLVRRRLQLIYHRADLLKTEKSNATFITTILIPQS